MERIERFKRKKAEAAASAAKAKAEGAGDHRKRRRNRTTQSCLNCHTSKRMCDRGRPCGRCTQLGLTSVCIYEVDDRSPRAGEDSEVLQQRVAELEGVINEVHHVRQAAFHPNWGSTTLVHR
ncbi:hypothetical protein PENSPDRAFT_641714 [Peniophora sp. CONT]|nr:hypothetical protein PENSPDRAFT_641714 [Peniophora sp. CONT]